MKERPILFSTPMVRAILEGRKTMTRRKLKMKKDIACPEFGYTAFTPEGHISVRGNHLPSFEYGESFIKCPYGQIGDRLWVRETFLSGYAVGGFKNIGQDGEPINDETIDTVYKADNVNDKHIKWTPSIFMPRTASRILLEITNIRVERLQDISEEDIMKEGVFPDLCTDHPKGCRYTAFMKLWQSINGNESWGSNPYVWVIYFKVINK